MRPVTASRIGAWAFLSRTHAGVLARGHCGVVDGGGIPVLQLAVPLGCGGQDGPEGRVAAHLPLPLVGIDDQIGQIEEVGQRVHLGQGPGSLLHLGGQGRHLPSSQL